MSGRVSYDHIICFTEDYYRVMFADCEKTGRAVYLKDPFPRGLLRRLAFSPKIPRPVRRPFLRLFCERTAGLLKKAAEGFRDQSKPLCFTLSRRSLGMLSEGLYDALKKSFPGSRTVVVFTDLLARESRFEKMVTEGRAESCADLLCTFDPGEAEKYGLTYLELPAPGLSERVISAEEEWDVVFIGRVKDRFDKIMRAWNDLSARGLRCGFFLYDVPEERRGELPEGMIMPEWMSYGEYLEREAKGRIILEIVQGGSTGSTLRVNEAVMMGKKLISDNPHLKNSAAWDENNMFVFKDTGDIPDGFLFSPAEEYSEKTKNSLSAEAFMDRVEEGLASKEAVFT